METIPPTGYPHPQLEIASGNDRLLLPLLGCDKMGIDARVQALMEEMPDSSSRNRSSSINSEKWFTSPLLRARFHYFHEEGRRIVNILQ